MVETAREDVGEPPAAYEPFLVRASDRRRADFAAGRWCAERALAAAGCTATFVPAAPDGAPVWPEGMVGSITHCAEYAAAAVAERAAVRAVGIDAEPLRPLPDGLAELVSSAEELAALPDGAHWPLVAFSAKEAAIKCWLPIAGRPIDFREVHLELDAAGRWFRACLAAAYDPGLAAVTGGVALTAGHVVTAAAVFVSLRVR